MLYKFTAFIDIDERPGRKVVALAHGDFSDHDKARYFARGFAWEIFNEFQQPVDVAFHAADSEFTSWVFCPIF